MKNNEHNNNENQLNPQFDDSIFNREVLKHTIHFDFFERYEGSRISLKKEVEIPQPVVKIHGMPVCTRQSLTLLSGASKAGKTAFTSILCAGAIKTANGYDGCPYIEVTDNTEQHAVIHIDTEQSESQQFNNMKNAVAKRAYRNEEPDYYYSYNSRDFSIEELNTFVKDLFREATKKHGGIHLAIIDGAADFLKSVNDEVEANDLIKTFGQLASEYNTSIILILHLNPGSTKERGHIGSQAPRKCETVLTITKDVKQPDVSVLEAKLLRNGSLTDFTPLAFMFDKHKRYHTFIDGYKKPDEARLPELAKQVFVERMNWSDSVKAIAQAEGYSERQGATTLKDMLDLGILAKAVEGRNTFYALKGYEDVPF